MKVLVVDDQEESRYLAEVLLKGNGYEVHAAANGVEALAQLQSGKYDLIISDVLMPVMDGFELCRRVKADERLGQIPFLIFTATYTGPEDEAFATKIGADRFLLKPCEPEAFMEAVRAVLASAPRGDVVSAPTPLPEEEVLKLYNERLVSKLEQKMLQLEKETRALREAEQALRHSEKKYRRLHESMMDGYVALDMQGAIRESNSSFQSMLGYTEEELARLTYLDLTPEKWHACNKDILSNQVLLQGYSAVYEKEYQRKDGSVLPVELRTYLVRDDSGQEEGMWAIVRDISERKRAERSKKELEDQLHQAQKMESIGRLAGGVAHDYNNMLSVILGYAQIALTKTEPTSSVHRYLQNIFDAAERSANITRQLLAFARKQTIAPQVLDLNGAVAGMMKMLKRLIGEDISLQWLPDPNLWPVKIDPTQVDQLLANLCVNARDAISGVGTITIETAMKTVDAAWLASHPEAVAGEYVRLAVSDDGCGMGKEILDKIFEPFFTTKGLGQGTGLGLATVYGIVKQNNGFIDVSSAPGQGATFNIYLPRHTVPVATVEQASLGAIPRGRGETVLVVEDEVTILELTRTLLEELGYTVLTACSPAEALSLARKQPASIRLLLADVIMPGMNGHNLAQQLLVFCPDLKYMFMSGYSASVIANQGVLDVGVNFIQKPFSARELAVKVHEVLS